MMPVNFSDIQANTDVHDNNKNASTNMTNEVCMAGLLQERAFAIIQ